MLWFQVGEGERQQLTQQHISATDPDSILTNLMVVIDSVPTVGVLKMITVGEAIGCLFALGDEGGLYGWLD